MEFSLLDIKYAYLAGVIDGEGCINILKRDDENRPGSHYQLRLIIAMAHKENILFMNREFGGRVHQVQQNVQWKIRYSWVVIANEAKKILERALPYLICKKQQALVAIAFQQLLEEHREYYGTRPVSKEDLSQRDILVEQLHELNKRGI